MKREPRRPRITLASGATAKLVIDTPSLVAFGAQHVQPAQQPNAIGVPLALLSGPLPGPLALLGSGFLERCAVFDQERLD